MTPKVVKVIYVLIMILNRARRRWVRDHSVPHKSSIRDNRAVHSVPTFFLVEVALWRIVLELFIVIFRIADDLRVIRVRADLRSDSAEANGISD